MLLFEIPKWPEAAQGVSSPPSPIPSAPLALVAQGPCTEFLGPKPAEAWPGPGTEWPSLLPAALSSPLDLGSLMKISVCLTPRMEALTWLPCAPVVSQRLSLTASFLVPSPSGTQHPADPSHLVHSGPLLETCQLLTSSIGLSGCHLCGTRDTGQEKKKAGARGPPWVCCPVVAHLDPSLTLWVMGSPAPASSSASREGRGWALLH